MGSAWGPVVLYGLPWVEGLGLVSEYGHGISVSPTLFQKEVDETLTTNVWVEQVSRDRRGWGIGANTD